MAITSRVRDVALATNTTATATETHRPKRRPPSALPINAKRVPPLPAPDRAVPFDQEKFRRLMNETSEIRDWLAARLPAQEPACPVPATTSGSGKPHGGAAM